MNNALAFIWHCTVFIGGRIVFIKSGAKLQDQSCAKPPQLGVLGSLRKLQSPTQMLPCKRTLWLMKPRKSDGQGCTTGSCFIPHFRMHKGSFLLLGAKPYWRYCLKPDCSVPSTSPLIGSVWPPQDRAIQARGKGERVCLWGCHLQKPGARLLCQLQGKSLSLLACCWLLWGTAESLAVDLTWLLDAQENGLTHSKPRAYQTSPCETESSGTAHSAIHTLQS